ncbi:MAG: hypothetical protein A2Y97_07585 [Nitrospirae bacterium RBG_13_39_12]|nr:MAG: hypothetical protein A2Y97_07585 [Nitrospirae bacterium RBG_13_39_12]
MKSRDNSNPKALETISILALACVALGLLFEMKVFFYVALVLLFIGIFVKKLSLIIAKGWLKFAHVLGTINSKIILTLIFFLFLTPIAVLYRIVKGDFMRLRKSSVYSKSYWIEKNHKYVSKDLENVW